MHNQYFPIPCPISLGLGPTSQTKPFISFLHCLTELPSTPHYKPPYSGASTPGPHTSILVPHGQHTENKGTERGCKEPSPVVVHSKVGRSDLDAEQYSCRGTNVGSGAGKCERLSPSLPPCGPVGSLCLILFSWSPCSKPYT